MLKNLRSLPIYFCFSTIFFVGGCGIIPASNSVVKSGASIYDRIGIDVIIEPTTGNSFILSDEKVLDQVCMAPPPDLSDAKGSSGSLAVKGVSLSENTSVSVAALGGRSPAVLISREILYRTCELYVNLRLKKEEAIELFKNSLSKIIDVTKAQILQGTTSQINAAGSNSSGVAVGVGSSDGSGNNTGSSTGGGTGSSTTGSTGGNNTGSSAGSSTDSRP
jgi:hypothetical protein